MLYLCFMKLEYPQEVLDNALLTAFNRYFVGFGDRLAGIVNVMAFALRFNRTLLISADNSFEDYFRPFHDENDHQISWKSSDFNTRWNWSNWQENYTYNMQTLHCINPKPNKQRQCSLDHDYDSQVVKIYSNRCYLCRWSVVESLGLQSQLLQVLGIKDDTDLLQVAGCLLRLVMWPTDLLWRDFNSLFQYSHYSVSDGQESNQVVDINAVKHQVGVHFRCGDSSFTHETSHQPNPQCVYINASHWKGTSFYDDKSLDSPVDLATCAKQTVLQGLQTQDNSTVVYIASDNIDSSSQIVNNLEWKYAITPNSTPCHVDLQASIKCSSITLLHWFMLSLSDTLILQALIIDDPHSIYHDPPIPGHDQEQGPISAFSRYAAIFGLSTSDMRYGHNCKQTNSYKLSRQTSGNWVCNPKRFF